MNEGAVRGRTLARAMLIATFAILALIRLLSITAPGDIGPMFTEPPRRLPLPEVGIAGILVGLIWMIRIDRAARDPERHRSTWRSHR